MLAFRELGTLRKLAGHKNWVILRSETSQLHFQIFRNSEAQTRTARPRRLKCCTMPQEERVDTISALVTVGFSIDDEPTANSKDDLTVVTSGSQDLRRRSKCNLRACVFPPCATRATTVGPEAGPGTAVFPRFDKSRSRRSLP